MFGMNGVQKPTGGEAETIVDDCCEACQTRINGFRNFIRNESYRNDQRLQSETHGPFCPGCAQKMMVHLGEIIERFKKEVKRG